MRLWWFMMTLALVSVGIVSAEITYVRNSPINQSGINANLSITVDGGASAMDVDFFTMEETFGCQRTANTTFITAIINTSTGQFDNKTVHISCDGAPKMTIVGDLAWVIGHSNPYITTHPVGALYNLTTMQQIKMRDFPELGVAEGLSQMYNLSVNGKSNWFIFYSEYTAGSHNLYYSNSTSDFADINFSEWYYYDTGINGLSNAYFTVLDADDELWIIYPRSWPVIVRYNKTGISDGYTPGSFGSVERLYDQDSAPIEFNLNAYNMGSKVGSQYMICHSFSETEYTAGVICLNTTDGDVWSGNKIYMNVSRSDLNLSVYSGFTSFIEKNGTIIAKTVGDINGTSVAAFFVGDSIDNLVYNYSFYYANGETLGQIVNYKDNVFYLTDMFYNGSGMDNRYGVLSEMCFPRQFNKSVRVGAVEGVNNGGEASVIWQALADSTKYYWFVNITDSSSFLETEVFDFETVSNLLPHLITLGGPLAMKIVMSRGMLVLG